MNMDASIILQGQPVNALGALAAGNDLAKQSNELRRQNALDALYKSQGAGIMNGDQNALNALAQFDPNAALGIKQTQQSMGFDAEKMGMLREEAKRAAAEYAKTLSDADRNAQIAKIESGLKGAAFFYQNGDRAGYDGFLKQNGLDPAQYPFEAFPATAAQYDGVLEAYKTFKPEVIDPAKGAPSGYLWNDPKDPRKGVAPISGMNSEPEWITATPEQAKAHGAVSGQINTKTGKFEGDKAPSGMKIESDGHGGFTFTEGPAAASTAKDEARLDQAKVSADVVTGKITEAKRLVANPGGWLPTTGYGGQKLMNTGGTAANDLRATLETIKANVAFDKLQQMRASSPTGGALGAVSDKEMSLLSAALTSLDQTQSAEQLTQNLDNLEQIYKVIIDKLNAPPVDPNAPPTQPPAAPQGGQINLPSDLQGVFNKYK